MSPAFTVVLSASFTTLILGFDFSGVTGTGLLGVVPAVATFVIVFCASISACVTSYFAYNVTSSPTSSFAISVTSFLYSASEYISNVSSPAANVILSVTDTFVNVTFPVFFTLIV